jgi:stage V sporulation protein S
MVLKVSSKSNPNSIAGCIAGLIKQDEETELHAIGAGALNQAIKAIIIAKSFLIASGYEIVINPSFKEVEIDGINRTCIKLKLEVK